MLSRALLPYFLTVLFGLGTIGGAFGQESDLPRAAEMLKAKQYRSAIRLLKKRENQSPQGLLIIGECHYLLKEYGDARSYFSRAFTKIDDPRQKRICENRLAMLSYRLGDFKGASERIDNFVRKYPDDKRAGTLLAVRMKIIAAGSKPNAEKIVELEPLHEKLRKDRKRYGYYNFVLASNTLGTLYSKAGDGEKANSVLVEAAHEMGGVISRYRTEKRSLPEDLVRGYDSMSLQIAKHYLQKKDYGQVDKWLGNVGYVPELTRQAKLLRAQVAMSRRDHNRVRETLGDEFLATVPAGEIKSAMHLVLGLAERGRKQTEKAKEYLKLVTAGDKGYAQAQHALGDIYREGEDPTMARKHYEISVNDKTYQAPALFHLAKIEIAAAELADLTRENAGAEIKALHQSAATRLNKLVTNYPLTNYAKDAKPLLAKLGVEGARAVATQDGGDKDQVAGWEKVAKEQPGTNAAAQALVSLAEYHSRELFDPSGTMVAKAPDWQKVAAAAGTILVRGDQPFSGVTADRWDELRTTMHFLRGRAELNSLPRGEHFRPRKGQQPTPLSGGGDADRAIADFEAARKLGKAAGRDLQEEWEMSLLEAMFKSGDDGKRAQAERRYAELESEYGSSARYQLLALNLADWFVERGDYALAAQSYRNVSRKGDLERDKAVHLLFLAGSYFSRAARAQGEGGRTSTGIYIYPKEILASPSFVDTHRPFRQTKRLYWKLGDEPRAGEVLKIVSKEFGIPFVWSPDRYKGSVADHLEKKRIPAGEMANFNIARPLAEYLELVLADTTFELDFDLGLSRGQATPTPAPAEGDPDPAAAERAQVIEIFDPGRERMRELTNEYRWDEHFKDKSAKSIMMFHIVKRIEEMTGARVFYAESVAQDDLLAREYESLPAAEGKTKPNQKASCGDVLRRTLAPMELTFRLTRRDPAAELFVEAKDCFNELRKFGRDTHYTERALFTLATNFSYQKDWEKMRLVLREYLKVFDHPGHPNYYAANFWLGWAFENQRNFREAARYYTRAVEESIVVFKAEPDASLAPIGEVKARLGYDTLYNLSLPASGSFDEAALTGRFSDFIRFNTNVALKFGPAATALDVKVTRSKFAGVPCFDLLYATMANHGLDLRSENADPNIAERAYYRLASVHQQQDALHEALENIDTLLVRFPETRRRTDSLKMRLDIYKGLKEYGKVLEAIADLRAAAEGTIDAYKFDYELGRVWFDMCDFEKAVGAYAQALSGAKATSERLAIREAYAQALARAKGSEEEARVQFEALLKQETSALRSTIARLMVRHLRFKAGDGAVKKALAPEEEKFIATYEATSDAQFEQLGANDYARATWIYYISGLRDLADSKTVAALAKFDAAAKSPDDYLAAEALLEAGLVHLKAGDLKAARDSFQHLLFSTHSVPGAVRATYYLAICHKKGGDDDSARRRLEEIVRKFPISPYAERARKDPLLQNAPKPAPPAEPKPSAS